MVWSDNIIILCRPRDGKTEHSTYLIASRAWEDSRLRVPVLRSGSVTSISEIISSISSLVTRPRYLLGVDKSLVGNLKYLPSSVNSSEFRKCH